MREETKLKGGDEIARHTKIREGGVNMLFKKFTDETEERDRPIVRRRLVTLTYFLDVSQQQKTLFISYTDHELLHT